MARRSYAAKVDANQGEIVRMVRSMFGPDSVLDLSAVGGGCPDLLIGVRGVNLFVELKTATGTFTPAQVEFHGNWRGQIAVVRTIDEALRLIERGTV